MDQPETPKQGEEAQEEGAEPTESLLASIEQGEETQEEGAEPTDSLLAIFEQETVPDTEALSLVEGLEDIDVHDLLGESRDIAKWLASGEKPH